MISIVCASNNEVVLEKMLISSLKKQTYKNYEIIIVNAKEKGFKSAAQALNYGASIAKGDLIIFIHQDIEFLQQDALEKIDEYSKKNDFAIAGLCGVVSSGEYKVYSSVTIGKNHRQAGIKIYDIMKIYALDECVLIVKKDKFSEFDDYGNTWHFYGVEYCIRANMNNENIFLFPIETYHLSPGWSLDYSYFDTLLKVASRYKNLENIKTCMGVFKNDWTLKFYCLYRKFKLWLKKILRYEGKN